MFSRVTNLLLCTGKGLYKSSYTCSCRIIQSEPLYKKRTFCSKNKDEKLEKYENDDLQHNPTYTVSEKYKVFRDEDAPVVFDVDEEKNKINLADLELEDEFVDSYEGLNLTRGISGVYEIEDLLDVLKKDNAKDIFVASVPREFSYVDYIVVVTGKTQRHMLALATFVRKVYKLKMHSGDTIPKIEGERSKDWIALDLGNIVLHVFSQKAREVFDLESLWSVGAKYDDQVNFQDPQTEIFEKYDAFLKELQPADG